MTALAARLRPKMREPVLINGKPIKGRLIQQIIWGVGLGFVVFGFFASGLYFGPIQVHWYIHLGSFYWSPGWAKPHWDKNAFGIIGPHSWLVNTVNWVNYRHPLRDIGLPALASMGAFSIIGGAKKPAGRLYTAVAPLLVLVLAVVLIIGGEWVILTLNAKAGGATQLVTKIEAIVLGIVIGRILHYIWRPAGTRIEHFIAERGVDGFFRKGHAEKGLPVWVELPLAPPTLREAAMTIINGDRTLQPGEDYTEAQQLASEGHTRRSDAIWVVVAVAAVIVVGVDFVGFIGHIWDGVFHLTFPYLAPGS